MALSPTSSHGSQPFAAVAIEQAAGVTSPGLAYTNADDAAGFVNLLHDGRWFLQIVAGADGRVRLALSSSTDSGEILLDNAFAYFQPRDDASDSDTYFEVTKKGGNDAFVIQAGGAIIAPLLPTSNPGVAGQLWNDTGTLKVSAGPP